MEQFEWACKNIDKINRKSCYEWADKNFSLDRVSLMYEEYFEALLKVHDGSGGFYAENPNRQNLDWLVRYYPDTITKVSESPSPLVIEVKSQSCDIPELHSKLESEKEDSQLTSSVDVSQ